MFTPLVRLVSARMRGRSANLLFGAAAAASPGPTIEGGGPGKRHRSQQLDRGTGGGLHARPADRQPGADRVVHDARLRRTVLAAPCGARDPRDRVLVHQRWRCATNRLPVRSWRRANVGARRRQQRAVATPGRARAWSHCRHFSSGRGTRPRPWEGGIEPDAARAQTIVAGVLTADVARRLLW